MKDIHAYEEWMKPLTRTVDFLPFMKEWNPPFFHPHTAWTVKALMLPKIKRHFSAGVYIQHHVLFGAPVSNTLTELLNAVWWTLIPRRYQGPLISWKKGKSMLCVFRVWGACWINHGRAVFLRGEGLWISPGSWSSLGRSSLSAPEEKPYWHRHPLVSNQTPRL